MEEGDEATCILNGYMEVVTGWFRNFKVKEEEMKGLMSMGLVYYRPFFIFGVLWARMFCFEKQVKLCE